MDRRFRMPFFVSIAALLMAVVCPFSILGVSCADDQADDKTQLKLFFTAVNDGKVAQVKTFIDSGIDVNARDGDNSTALHCAAAAKQVDVIRLLIAAGADVNAAHYLDGTALHLAVVYCPIEAIRELIAAGADVNSDDSRYGPTPLHGAAERGNTEIIQLLIDSGAKVDTDGMTPLTAASRVAKGNQTQAIQVLLAAGAAVNPKGEAPLHWVRSPAVTKLLIDAGADVNHRDKLGRTPLHLAPAPHWGPREDEVQLMIAAGADVNARDKNKSTPLHAAAQNKFLKVAQLLIDAGAELDARDADGNTPLSMAQFVQSAEMVAMLTDAGADDGQTLLGRACIQGELSRINELIAAGADVNEIGPLKKTALHLACEHKQLNAVRALLAAKADVNAQAANGWTPLHLATNKEIALALINAGANKNPEPPSPFGTPLFIAATSGRGDVVEALLDKDDDANPNGLVVWVTFFGQADVLKILLAHDANADGRFPFGPSALLVAASGTLADMACAEHVTPEIRLKMAKLLIDAGADVNVPCDTGFFRNRTVLHAAAERGELEMVKLALKHDANPNVSGAGKYFGGVTPLHLAAKNGNVKVVRALLDAGANVNAKTGKLKFDGQKTPLDLCKSNDVRRLLVEHGGKRFSEVEAP